MVPPDGEHGAAVRCGDDVAVLLLLEKPGGDDQLDHLPPYPAALGVEPGPGGDLPDGARLRVFADHGGNDGYSLEITRDGQTVRYDAGHSAREVQAFLALFT
ncbi:hypothetical protein [Kitasatospora sp. NPDC091276]|uniref:hypothetical protein n=1 Tax=Kitasatospora sp. NPDC091276 TaxID=3155300 RepID=UPI003444200D